MSEHRMGSVANHHLEPHVLAAYVDGNVDAGARAQIEAHLATCDRCYDVMVEVVALQEDPAAAGSESPEDPGGDPIAEPAIEPGPAPRKILPFSQRRTLTIVSSALAVAAALALIIQLDPSWLRRFNGGGLGTPELHELAAAVGTNRLIEPRLSGGFAWGPVPSPMRSGTVDRRLTPDVRIAIANIERVAEEDPTPERVHALGVAHLIAGDADEAVRRLELASSARPADARVSSDLSAAYYSRARARDDRDDLLKALQAAERAVAADESLPEAWFNFALAREAAGQTELARDAWNRYLQLDPSGWRAEAESRLK